MEAIKLVANKPKGMINDVRNNEHFSQRADSPQWLDRTNTEEPRRGGLLLCLLLLLLLSACTSEQVVEVPVTQIVEVTRQIAVEVIREIEVTRKVPVEVAVEVTVEVEVTRQVPVEVEVTRVVVVEVTSDGQQTTQQVAANSETPVEVTVVSVGSEEASDSSTDTANPPSLATTIAIAGQDTNNNVACWTWQEAAQHIGEYGCVEGNVTGVGDTPNAFFINFSQEQNSFYVVAFDWAWEELTGECLRVSGVISEYKGRPQMIIDSPPTQMYYCGNNEDGPPAFER